MDYTKFRQWLLKVFIGFLGITALIAILSVLAGQFGELQGKILGTTATISGASVCSMSCAAFIEKRKRVLVGLLGVALAVLSGLFLITGIWLNIHSEVGEKFTGTLLGAALAFAAAFLLLLPDLDKRHKWVQSATWVSIGVLALQGIVAIWINPNNDWYFRLLTVVAILVGLETIVIPILMKLRKGEGPKAGKMVLENIDGDLYRDPSGQKYRLIKIVAGPAVATAT